MTKFKNEKDEAVKLRSKDANDVWKWDTVKPGDVVDVKDEDQAKEKGLSEVKAVKSKAGDKEVETKVQETSHTCDECGKSFDSKRGLSVHQTQAH